MSALDKVLLAAGWGTDLADPADEMVLAARTAVGRLVQLAKYDPDDDGDDDASPSGDTDHDYAGKKKASQDGKSASGEGGGSHSGHGTFKALVKKGMDPKKAAAKCAKEDNKAEMTALAESAVIILAALFDDGLVALTPASETAAGRRKAAKSNHALPDGSYPIEDVKHLHSAATLAASHHGNWQAAKALIRRRAKELGVDVTTLPGFGGEKDANEKKVAATIALAAGSGQMKGTVAQAHPPFHGVHAHMHVHHGDNMHGGSPDRVPGQSYGAY